MEALVRGGTRLMGMSRAVDAETCIVMSTAMHMASAARNAQAVRRLRPPLEAARQPAKPIHPAHDAELVPTMSGMTTPRLAVPLLNLSTCPGAQRSGSSPTNRAAVDQARTGAGPSC